MFLYEVLNVRISSIAMVKLYIILDSSMVEHSAVNRVVVGSSPTRGAVRIIMIVKQVGHVVLLVQY